MVQCHNKDCHMWRDLPKKYINNYEQQQWQTTFKCSKLKLRGLSCGTKYTFRQEMYDIKPYDQCANQNQENLWSKKSLQTRIKENCGNKDSDSSTIKNPLPEICDKQSSNNGLGILENVRITRRREAKRLQKEELCSNSNEDMKQKRFKDEQDAFKEWQDAQIDIKLKEIFEKEKRKTVNTESK